MSVTTESVSPQEAVLLIQAGHPGPLSVQGTLDLSIDRQDVDNSRRGKPKQSKSPADKTTTSLQLPAGLQADFIDLHGRKDLQGLPPGIKAYELNLADTRVRSLPSDLQVENCINLTGCEFLESLPAGLHVGSLLLRGCTALTALPEDLDVWSLDLTGCWALRHWPARAKIHSGRLLLRGCTALTELPPYLQNLAAVDVRDCPNLRKLPEGLRISGWLDIAHSGLTEDENSLPSSLDNVQLRWAGIPISRQYAFHPERMDPQEILKDKNAERRRAMLDRYGYPRFMHDVGADVLDQDTDPGGQRQLLQVKIEGDEPLVALSCFCPSTGRQYIIRVPPQMPTCRHAAAWIAGFDDPDDYQPIVET